MMSEQEMRRAVVNNDAGYDGVFFYAVKTTGMYCRPSCKSKAPNRENICFFESSEQARKAVDYLFSYKAYLVEDSENVEIVIAQEKYLTWLNDGKTAKYL